AADPLLDRRGGCELDLDLGAGLLAEQVRRCDDSGLDGAGADDVDLGAKGRGGDHEAQSDCQKHTLVHPGPSLPRMAATSNGRIRTIRRDGGASMHETTGA